MKRILSLVIALALCAVLLSSAAFATDFVPSIGDKDHPEIVPGEGETIGVIVDEDGNVISEVQSGCIVVTPVSEAETSKEIPEDARQTLQDVYDQLSDGSMELPYDPSVDSDEMVIRDLFDVSFLCDEHPEMLENGGQLQLAFDLGVAAGDTVVCMVYVNGEWIPVELVNNGDGTVTCLFSQICPVVFCVRQSEAPPQTGDFGGNDVLLWGSTLLLSIVALVVCIVVYRRKYAHHD